MSTTLDDFANSLWSNLSLSPKTIKNYRNSYKHNIRSSLGNLKLVEIKKSDITSCLLTLQPNVAYQTLMSLRCIFKFAHRLELVVIDPTEDLKTPKTLPKQLSFLTWEELSKLEFGKQANRIRFLALHGLRYSEAAALTVDDIKKNRVYINKSIYGATKSRHSVRSVPYLGHFEMFPKYQNSIADKLKPFGVNVHSLRKTYAYILKTSNVHVTTAAKLMGHSNPLITLKLYTQVKDDEIDIAGIAMNKFLNDSNDQR
jgi:integrase